MVSNICSVTCLPRRLLAPAILNTLDVIFQRRNMGAAAAYLSFCASVSLTLLALRSRADGSVPEQRLPRCFGAYRRFMQVNVLPSGLRASVTLGCADWRARSVKPRLLLRGFVCACGFWYGQRCFYSPCLSVGHFLRRRTAGVI